MEILKTVIGQRILVLDGAMGTMLQRYGFDDEKFRGDIFRELKGPLVSNFDLLTLSQPQAVKEVHNRYLQAGADIITTNTFSSNSLSLSDYSAEKYVRLLNYQAARLARESADSFTSSDPSKPRFVAGSMGPANKSCSISPKVEEPGYRAVTFEELRSAYKLQAEALLDGGVDLLLVETVFDTLNAKAALFAIDEIRQERGCEIPVMLSATISGNSGRLLSGQSVEAFLISVSHSPLFSIGLNCSFGADLLKPWMRILSSTASVPVSLYPNAGLPDEDGRYGHTPEIMARYTEEYLKEGLVNIVGGCCGTTPEHIKLIAELAERYKPRRVPVPKKEERALKLSGLNPLVVSPEINFVNIGERTNVAGSKKFLNLIREEKYEEAVRIAADQVANGAQIIDVSMDDGMVDGVKAMTTFLNLAGADPAIAAVPVMLDSSRWDIIEAGLKVIQGKGVVNSISLKEGEEVFVERARLIRRYGAAAVVMAFDEQGPATNPERVREIFERSFALLTLRANFPQEEIIFDPNVFPVSTGMESDLNNGVNFFESVRWIKKRFPLSNISGGVSNVSFSFRGNNKVREAVNSAFLYHAVTAGMGMGIVNPQSATLYNTIPAGLLELVEDVLLNRKPGATERLTEYALKENEQLSVTEEKSDNRSDLPLRERIINALVTGDERYLSEDIEEARIESGNPVQVIEDYLIKGMAEVGELFECGKMYLPQVIKSARVMKQALSFILPYINSNKGNDTQIKTTSGRLQERGCIVLATVDGDIHDIGKNIISSVLSCYQFRIVDLGVMVPASLIIEAAVREKADIIGVSGLITPSLAKMEILLREMESLGMKTPVIIGGATTSQRHTAIRLAPLYSGDVVHVPDASKVVNAAISLISSKEEYSSELRKKYEKIREENSANKSREKLISLSEARENRLRIEWGSYKPPIPDLEETIVLTPSLSILTEYIDWEQFFVAWQLNAGKAGLSEEAAAGRERLLSDALRLIDKADKEGLIKPVGICKIFKANSCGYDDIEIYGSDEEEPPVILHTLRQQAKKPVSGKSNSVRSSVNSKNLALADFVMPAECGRKDYIGAFFVTAGVEAEGFEESFERESDHYYAIMARLISDRIAEAFSEYLHEKVRRELWGYESKCEDENQKNREDFRGIRPAPGYPALPDHTAKEIIWKLLDVNKITGATLTGSMAMKPASSVSGFYFAHPLAKYFSVGKILPDQVEDYAFRKGITVSEANKWLEPWISKR
ncbi:MAG: methionine synthase [Bacteroidales bacterium]|nr:methionine synthase [Bacteroidales bacterium]MDD2425137.1 methionine synthase [Bacteroidales bacterium]MDD3989442.1 methionine synthase [Bacteroidales bacterium]MDD4638833.1 methionine synthase [Bacteroidales bacterium]